MTQDIFCFFSIQYYELSLFIGANMKGILELLGDQKQSILAKLLENLWF